VEPVPAASPLGRYSDIVAAMTAVALVIATVLAHTGLLSVADTAWLDTSAGLALGVILGQRATTNGAGRLAATAHHRLDKIGAPPADDGVS
jgi:hypothetical protein